jgi:hypothetical protein
MGAVPQSRFLHDNLRPRRPAAAGTLPILLQRSVLQSADAL